MREIPLQMAKQHSLIARKWYWIGRGIILLAAGTMVAAYFQLAYWGNWSDVDKNSREREQKMGPVLKKVLRLWYRMSELPHEFKNEDIILKCYKELEMEKQKLKK